jgi:hypothetical protein
MRRAPLHAMLHPSLPTLAIMKNIAAAPTARTQESLMNWDDCRSVDAEAISASAHYSLIRTDLADWYIANPRIRRACAYEMRSGRRGSGCGFATAAMQPHEQPHSVTTRAMHHDHPRRKESKT